MSKPERHDCVYTDALGKWEAAFFQLHRWLDADRRRREVCIKADGGCDLWQVYLYIGSNIVNVATGTDLPATVAEVMTGMVTSKGPEMAEKVE